MESFGLTDDADQAAHSALGASGAHRWLNCPGSFALSRKAPAGRPSIYAATGTLAHSLIEQALKKGPQVLDLMRGSVVTTAGYEIAVDDDFIEGIEVMLNYVTGLSEEVPTKIFRIEETVYLDAYFRRRDPPPVRLFGRLDVAVFDEFTGEVEIIDYKNGTGVIVDPTDNPQMLYYAAGLLPQLPNSSIVKTIKLTIVQPHARSLLKVRSSSLHVIDLLMWIEDTLIPGVEACAKDDAPLNPGSYCRFCPASFACPALHAKAVEMAKKDFAQHTLPGSPDELAEALNTAVLAEAWIDAIRSYAMEQLKQQVRIPGWGLGPTRPVRRWKDESAVQSIASLLGYGPDAYRHDLLTPAQMEKLAKRKGTSWDTQFAPLVESVSSGVKLVRTETTNPLDDFDEF